MSNELGIGWTTVPLGTLVAEAGVGLVRAAADQHVSDGLPYVRMNHFGLDGEWDLSDLSFVQASSAEAQRYELQEGDVLFNTRNSEELVGKTAIWPGNLSGYVYNNNLLRLRFCRGVLPRFVALQMRSPQFREALEDAKSATTSICAIYQRDLLQKPMLVPPLNEQRRIVAKLEDLLARSRRAKDALDAIPPLLEKLRQSILASAFRGDLTADWRAKHPDVEPAHELLKRIRAERRKKWEEAELSKMRAKGKVPADDRWKAKYQDPEAVDVSGLPELPEGWCWASMEELCPAEAPIVYGIIQPGEDVPNGTPYIRPLDITGDGQVDMGSMKRTSPEIAQQYTRSRLTVGDLVLSIVGTIGKVLVVPPSMDGANITQSSVRIRVVTAIVAAYVRDALMSPQLTAQFDTYRFGVAVQGLNVEHARRLAVPIAPIAEQHEVARLLRRSLGSTGKASVGAARAQCETLDAAVLAKAFRGELVEQDPNDEPASVMLERLASERTASESAKPARAPAKREKRAR